MPGEVYPEYDPYPPRGGVLGALQAHFGQTGSGVAGAKAPGGGPGGGDPLRRVGPSEPEVRAADVLPPAPESRAGGSWARLDEPLMTRVTRGEPDAREQSVQRLLSQAGYHVSDDGYFGPESIAALNEFVASNVSPQLRFDLGDEIPSEILLTLQDAARR